MSTHSPAPPATTDHHTPFTSRVYIGKSATVGDTFIQSNSGHWSGLRHGIGAKGGWYVFTIGGGVGFDVHADAVVDNFGNLVRVPS